MHENDLGGSPRLPGGATAKTCWGRRAMHHAQEDAGILTEAMHYADPAYLQSYTSVVEGLSTLERDLTALEPKACRSRVACN